ncbi:MAG: fumarate reductase iron-sulfur subunit [bacterium]
MADGKARTLTFRIFRHNPADPASRPHLDEFTLEETFGLNLFVALSRLREEQDPTLQFDFACRAAVCGSCAMLINGKPSLGCQTLTRDLPATITLMPLPGFKLIGDLSVDTGTWFRALNRRVEAWIHVQEERDPNLPEERMDDATALRIYESERCIECGCCLAGCATVGMNENFVGPAGMNRVARFMLDPRDTRGEGAYFEIVATPDGIFGCLGLMACHDVCPKKLSLQETFGYMRRTLAKALLHPASSGKG